MGFDEIVGQSRAKKFLINSLKKNRVGHAYLFVGPEGTGKMLTARTFAMGLNCSANTAVKPCDRCLSCKRIQKGIYPDIKIIEPQGSSIRIEQIRELQREAVTRPYEGRKKVFIIDQGDKMTVEAGNCLLKTFEEPPEYVVIIILTINENMILPTLLSRAQIVTFDPLPLGEIEKYLYDRLKGSDDHIKLYAAFSEGSIGRALQIAESDEFTELREEIIKLIQKVSSCSMKDVFKISEALQKKDMDMNNLLDFFLYWYRDVLITKTDSSFAGIVNYDKKQELFDESRILDYYSLLTILKTIQDTQKALQAQANKALTLDVMLMEIKGVYENVHGSRGKI